MFGLGKQPRDLLRRLDLGDRPARLGNEIDHRARHAGLDRLQVRFGDPLLYRNCKRVQHAEHKTEIYVHLTVLPLGEAEHGIEYRIAHKPRLYEISATNSEIGIRGAETRIVEKRDLHCALSRQVFGEKRLDSGVDIRRDVGSRLPHDRLARAIGN